MARIFARQEQPTSMMIAENKLRQDQINAEYLDLTSRGSCSRLNSCVPYLVMRAGRTAFSSGVEPVSP